MYTDVFISDEGENCLRGPVGGRDQKFCFLCSCPCGLVLLQAGWHSRDVPTDSVQSSNIELIIIDVYKSFAACSNQMVHSLMASLS